jgi:hypothetical protein
MNERTMDTIKMEAERKFQEMMEEFQRSWLGRRAEYGSTTRTGQENELPGEDGGQLVQRGGAPEDATAESIESQLLGKMAGAGAGAPRPVNA